MPAFSLIPTLVTVAAVAFVILNVVALLTLVERKVSAYLQDRIGPNRVGPFGLLQPFVDGVKMLLKEDIIPSHVDTVFYVLAPAVGAATALLAFAVVPFGPTTPPPEPVAVQVARQPNESAEAYQKRSAEAQNAEFQRLQEEYQSHYQFVVAPGLDIGILFTFCISSLAVYGIILGGWSSNNKYSMLGALRSSAQVISYEIPLGMSILGVVLVSGSLNLERIIDYQIRHGWNLLYQPLAFLLFLTSVMAECNRLPFDLPEAEQELIGGYHTEYSSIKFGLFMLGEFAHVITTSFLLAVVFLGGWHLPFGLTEGDGWFPLILKVVSILGKTSFFIFFYVLIRWTIPRFRFDQLMAIAWKVLIPLAIMNLIAVLFVKEFGLSMWVLTVLSVVLLVGTAYVAGRRSDPVRRNAPTRTLVAR